MICACARYRQLWWCLIPAPLFLVVLDGVCHEKAKGSVTLFAIVASRVLSELRHGFHVSRVTGLLLVASRLFHFNSTKWGAVS